MRVKDCLNCRNCGRYTWSHPYTSASGRRVGMTHAYRWCRYYKLRCSEVKNCDFPAFIDD